MNVVDREKMSLHRTRADSFLDSMKFLADDLDNYEHSVALLAVHSAISLTDAVRYCCTGKRGKDADHSEAVRALRKICSHHNVDKEGVNHLSWLIARKTDFAYGDRRVDRKDVESATVHAERFEAWVERYFSDVVRERNDA